MVEIEGVRIGEGQPCRFVAEIGNAHNGNETRAARLIEAAAKAGADFVKFQAFTVDELIALRGDGPAPEPWASQGHTMSSLYNQARTPLEWFPGMFSLARTLGVVPFASVFGPESLALMEDLGCPAYKVAALDEGNLNHRHAVIETAKRTGAPIIASTPGDKRMDWADIQLHCPPGYPQEWQDIDFHCFPDTHHGLSYHGVHPISLFEAARNGAQVLEFHFHLENEPSELEANVSIDERQLALVTSTVREMEALRSTQ